MTIYTLAGHEIEFADCREVGQGGPDTCSMSIDGEPVLRRMLWGQPRTLRFHPTPLEVDGKILVPLWEATRFYLVRIDPLTLKVRRLSRGYAYMRLLRVADGAIEFSTWWDDRETRTFKLA